MGFVYGDENCIDPLILRAECIRQNFPINWFGLANQYRCPLGCAPGQGALLLSYDSLNKLDLSAANDGYRVLRVESADTANGVQFVEFPSILIVGQATAINPASDAAVSGSGGLPTAYLVPIADKRWLFWDRGATVTKRYNVRDDSTGAYVTTTLNGGVAWTWQQIVNDLWPSGLGTAPTLPFTPDGTPEGLWWHLQTPMFALQELLNRLACDLRYDPVADTFDIVRLGVDTGGVAADAVAGFNKLNCRILDSYSLISQLAQLPEKIKVEFRVKKPYTNGNVPYYTVEQSVTPAAGAAASGTYVTLQDDMYALCTDGSSITNAAALTTRATERVTDFVRKRQYFDSGEDYTYSGAIDVSEALGGFYRLVAWEDRGMMGGGVLARLQAGDLLDQRLENWRRGDTHDDGARWHYFKRDMPVYEAEPTTGGATLEECCEGFFGSDLDCCCEIFGHECGCDCGGGSGGGGSTPPPPSGGSSGPDCIHSPICNGKSGWVSIPPIAGYEAVAWCGPGFYQAGVGPGPGWSPRIPNCDGTGPNGCWDCVWIHTSAGGSVQVPIGGIGAPGPFPPSQPRPPAGGFVGPPGAGGIAPPPGGVGVSLPIPGNMGPIQFTKPTMPTPHAGSPLTRLPAPAQEMVTSFGDGLSFGGVDAGSEVYVYPNQGGSTENLGTIAAPALSSSQNNYAPGVCSVLQVTTDNLGPQNITGISMGQVDGQTLYVQNTGGIDNIVLKVADSSSSVGNRIVNNPFNSVTDITLGPGVMILLKYSGVSWYKL